MSESCINLEFEKNQAKQNLGGGILIAAVLKLFLLWRKDRGEGKGRRCYWGDGIDLIPHCAIAIFHQDDFEETDE